MKTIQPLTYKIKLYKEGIEEKINEYKDINYFKKSLENFLFFSDNMEKYITREIDGKKISLNSEIEIKDNKYIFINFKYGGAVNEHDNSIIIENEEITQELKKTGDMLSDYPCGIEFSIREDSKFLIIEGKMTILANGNQQMKGKIEKMFKEIYKQDKKIGFTNPEYRIDFFMTKEEIKIIDKRVRSVIFQYEVEHLNIFKKLESNKTKNKTARIKVEFSNFGNYEEEKELLNFIKGLEKENGLKVGKLVSKNVRVRQNGKYYQGMLKDENDEFIVQSKELVLENKKDISFFEFKKISEDFFK
ncbi:hypothetical protein DLH72_00010 [Candidatus Gracilibacteria bacterium]|nr:MAG: hypothetical protein DLH72_00010 [Candidatus Gracilibacteria bacterium]